MGVLWFVYRRLVLSMATNGEWFIANNLEGNISDSFNGAVPEFFWSDVGSPHESFISLCHNYIKFRPVS
jgi:hypothetical protein